jgi:hypothetical protein
MGALGPAIVGNARAWAGEKKWCQLALETALSAEKERCGAARLIADSGFDGVRENNVDWEFFYWELFQT